MATDGFIYDIAILGTVIHPGLQLPPPDGVQNICLPTSKWLRGLREHREEDALYSTRADRRNNSGLAFKKDRFQNY